MATADNEKQETRMRIGNKKIFHLEAWVVKVMSLYKVGSSLRLSAPTEHYSDMIIICLLALFVWNRYDRV